MECQPPWEGTQQGDSLGPGHPLTRAGAGEADGVGFRVWSRAFKMGSASSGDADSAETHSRTQGEGTASMAWVPWHLGSNGGWRAAPSIG